jgi:dephospho-CoA kinase
MNGVPAPAARRWVLGLTGGIASGKSTVAALFARLGIPVIDLDQVARDVVAPGSPLLAEIFRRFGDSLRQSDGTLDRRALRARVFADEAQRRELETLLHPAIRVRTDELLATADGPYQIVVHPLLAESGARDRYDRVLLVDCDPARQRERLSARDGTDPELVEAMLAAQATRAQRLAVADDVIVNDEGPDGLQAQVAALHRRYLALAQSANAQAQ